MNNKAIIFVGAVVGFTIGMTLPPLRFKQAEPEQKTMPDGEHIADSPAENGLSVTIDHENGVICYRERRYNDAVALSCMPYAEPDAPITYPQGRL